MKFSTPILGIFVGKVKNRWSDKPATAIAKFSTLESVQLAPTGFAPDEQADLRVHGGLEKAVHHYPADHYSHWQALKFPTSFAFGAGGFGENISTAGVTETDVCIGDVFELGTARVQISQGRQPCWKLNMHTRVNDMALHVQKSGLTGWYYRVLEQGEVKVGDKLKLLDRPHQYWPMNRLVAARFDKKLAAETALEISQIEDLADNWRNYFAKKAKTGFEEDQTSRLVG